jgi:hypothetical protein
MMLQFCALHLKRMVQLFFPEGAVRQLKCGTSPTLLTKAPKVRSCFYPTIYSHVFLLPPCNIVAQHTEPIKSIAFVPSLSCVATGSWDKTVKYWDVRTAPTGTPQCNVDLLERVYAMDVRDHLMVVCMAPGTTAGIGGKQPEIRVYDLRKPQTHVQVSGTPCPHFEPNVFLCSTC